MENLAMYIKAVEVLAVPAAPTIRADLKVVGVRT
jgi:hypothetical protein